MRCHADHLAALIHLLFLVAAAHAANFTSDAETATKFGVHEIVLTGDGTVANPFDTVVSVRFAPASEGKASTPVRAFYDGGNTWRARVYPGALGAWKWSSECATDPRLHGRSGAFTVADSQLRGRLLPHPGNPRQWMTEDGRWFLNLNDTAYFLLCTHDANGQPIPEQDVKDYARDAAALGVTSFRCFLASSQRGFRESTEQWTNWIFTDAEAARLRLDNLQSADRRLRWLLDQHPDMAVQLILLPIAKYGKDEDYWVKLSAAQKERALAHLVARFAAFPQIFWLIANDIHYGENFPNNNALAREVGTYLMEHDPWQHPRSTGPARRIKFPFGDEGWATYIHIEHEHDLGALQYAQYHPHAKPVFLGEDRYEQDHGPAKDPAHMNEWQRRLDWAWLLSGGSANYGGRWPVVHPYTQTGTREVPCRWNKEIVFRQQITGLDSTRFIRDYFAQRKIELSDFEPDPALVRDADGAAGARAPKLMRRAQNEFLIYHPNAASDGRDAKPEAAKTPGIIVDLRKAKGAFSVEWYRVFDGNVQPDPILEGGKEHTLRSPWPGQDCVLRLWQQ